MFKRSRLICLSLLLICSVTAACNQPVQSPPTPTSPQPPTTARDQLPGQKAKVDEPTDETEWSLVQTFNGKGSETTPPFHISGTKWRITWTIDVEHPEYAIFDLIVYSEDKPDMPMQRISYSSDSSINKVYIYEGGHNYHLKIIAANLVNWTVTAEDYTAAKAFISPVQITYINFTGRDYIKTLEMGYDIVEADEYVEIKNLSDSQQNIAGWVLKNISKGTPPFVFSTFKPCSCSWYNNWQSCIENCYPQRPCVIEPHKSVRVYTGEVHPESGGFFFSYTPGDFWNNEKPDIAVLYDFNGQEVSRKSYIIPTKE